MMTSDSASYTSSCSSAAIAPIELVYNRGRAELTDILRDAERNNLLDNDLADHDRAGAMRIGNAGSVIMVPRSDDCG
ncbi:MAG: hypothetical protein U1F34_05740 [Gammaproteobacteria bacterium]